MRTSSFQVFQSDKDQQYYWHLRAVNHEIILRSEGYQTKQGALDGIQSVRENAPFDERYQRLDAKNGEFYFVLKAANGKVIGVSETYTTKAAREVGIAAVKREAPIAPIKDLTEQDSQQKDEAQTVGAAEATGGLFVSPKSDRTQSISVKPKGGVYGKD